MEYNKAIELYSDIKKAYEQYNTTYLIHINNEYITLPMLFNAIDTILKQNADEYNMIQNDNIIYKFQYENLRHNFDKISDTILGKDYYNFGCDTYTTDNMTTEDILKTVKCKHKKHKPKHMK